MYLLVEPAHMMDKIRITLAWDIRVEVYIRTRILVTIMLLIIIINLVIINLVKSIINKVIKTEMVKEERLKFLLLSRLKWFLTLSLDQTTYVSMMVILLTTSYYVDVFSVELKNQCEHNLK